MAGRLGRFQLLPQRGKRFKALLGSTRIIRFASCLYILPAVAIHKVDNIMTEVRSGFTAYRRAAACYESSNVGIGIILEHAFLTAPC